MTTVRAAREADLPTIASIHDEAVHERRLGVLHPHPASHWPRWLADRSPDRHAVLVAETSGTVAGWLALDPYRGGRAAFAGSAEVSYFVASEHRGRGVGGALFDAGIARAREIGFEFLIAILLGDNASSIGLLEGRGFERWGTMPGVASIDGRRVDHVYFGRRITAE